MPKHFVDAPLGIRLARDEYAAMMSGVGIEIAHAIFAVELNIYWTVNDR